jgi:hypothetical protein
MKKRELVNKELKELIKRINELQDNELDVPEFQKLTPMQQQLLNEQRGAMTAYRQVLVLRMHYGIKEDK